MKQHILIADDEPDVLTLVGASFSSAGFEVSEAEDGHAAVECARCRPPALVVLDIMMPGLTGLEVTRTLKRDPATAAIPIILLSARAGEVDRVLGFELGADDFVTKPFSPRELVLRARAILQRKTAVTPEPAVLRVGAIEVNQEEHHAAVNSRAVSLTAMEFKLIVTLARGAGRVFEREALINQVWGDDSEVDARTVDTHIRRLRSKLAGAGEQIETIRGFGYRLDGAAG